MTVATPDRELEPERAVEHPEPPPPAPPPRGEWADFLGGRVLAWLGGLATLIAIVLLLALAISHGWIGPVARVDLAGAASVALMAAGMWLHARRGRTEAAVTMVGTATAGSFATLIVAGEVYRLIPALLAVVLSMLVGALATALAIRWAGRVIAGLGLIGALVSPVLIGAPATGATMATLAVGVACALWVVLWRRWPVLAFAALAACAPQWVLWIARGHATLVDLAVLSTFGLLGLLGAVFVQVRSSWEGTIGVAGALALLNALLIGVIGRLVFDAAMSAGWLAGVAVVHGGVALWRWPRPAIDEGLKRILLAIAVISADVALGLGVHGVALSAAWGATAVGSAWLVRRTARQRDQAWLGVVLGEHIGLVLTRALIELPPSRLSGSVDLGSVAVMAILATACLGSARAAGDDQPLWTAILDALGLLAILYTTAAALDGGALVGAWCGEAAALFALRRRWRADDPVCWYGGLAFLGIGAVYAIVALAPPAALVAGVASLVQAAIALGAVAGAALAGGLAADRGSRTRQALIAGATLSALYLASVAIVTPFQPGAGGQSDLVLDLPIRQQGQVLLSALWGVVGVAALFAGLRRQSMRVRVGALALLLVTVLKVFVYDLSTLTSIYRVASFFVLGILLLGGAFAYQRLRPPPPPDLRSHHPSQR
jgi:uncharacterized membrane protein